jgi:outer membrane protein OmpA-like peptidoglycan-associated protein
VTTATSSDTSRTLYAVWTTKVNYNSNGADSGALPGGKVFDNYRFGQTLTLSTAGTMVKSGFAFGGWMPTAAPAARSTTYLAANTATGNPTLYAAWIKTVSFSANGATAGTIPQAMVYVSGGERLKLPTISEMTLRKTGYEFMGWSTSQTGKIVSSAESYVPVVAQRSLFAIWKIQSTKATARVFYNPGKTGLRAGQKLVLRDLVDSLKGATGITIALAATRASSDAKKIGKARNTAVLQYLQSLGVEATFIRTNKFGASRLATAKKNNRVTLEVSWTGSAG